MGRNKLPLFYHYLLSYLLLLLIPILLIGLLIYQRFVGILQEEITLGHRHVLEQARSEFGARINEMNKIAIELSSRPELSPDKLNKSMSYALDAMETLRYTASNPFFRHIVLYLKDNDYMYAPNTSYPVSLFASEFYRYDDWAPEQFLRDIHSLNGPQLRPAEPVSSKESGAGRMLTYLVPIPYNSPSPYGVLLFLVEEESVRKLLKGALEERNGNSAIIGPDGQLIAALHHEAYLESDNFKQAALSGGNGSKTAKLDGQSYVISALKADRDGWTYVTMLPANVFMYKATQVKAQFFLSIVVVLLVGSALIYMLMRLNYRPVDQLLAFIGKQWGDAVRNVHDARGKIGLLAEDHRLLRTKLDKNKEAARNHLLLNLLRGQISDIGDCNAEGSDVGIVFTKPLFFAAMVECVPDRYGPEDPATGSNAMETMFRRYFESYRVDTMDDAKSTFVCAISPEEEPSWHRLLTELHRELSDRFGYKVTMGVGELYGEIGQAGKSYIEAATAIDYKLIKGHNTLITYREIRAEHASAAWYPKEEMELLSLHMQQGDTVKVEEILHNLQRLMQERPLPLHIARCICYDVLGCMIKTHYRLQPMPSESLSYPDVFDLAGFDTMHDLIAYVRHMCQLVRQSAESADKTGADGWISYIQANYQEHDFSVQRMADHFSVSRSYLISSFKKLTGQTIMDYLDHYRLERAKQLLADGDLQLKEVVQNIGYYDVSSFIRKFKQRMNMTPGEFRKLSPAKENAPGL